MEVAAAIWLVSQSANSQAHMNGLSITFYYEVADTCVPYLVVCTSFLEGSSGVVATWTSRYPEEGDRWIGFIGMEKQ